MWDVPEMSRINKEFEPIHAHPAYFGSELCCEECNPICGKKSFYE